MSADASIICQYKRKHEMANGKMYEIKQRGYYEKTKLLLRTQFVTFYDILYKKW